MGKFYTEVGYGITEENPVGSGKYKERRVTANYYGELFKPVTKWSTTESVNDDLSFSAQISIMADPFAIEHFSQIRYIVYCGVKWKVVKVEPQRPRLILTLGETYNGE